MKKVKWKQYIAPIVITAFFSAYMVFYAVLLVNVLSGIAKVLFALVPAALTAVLVYVCIQRIKEIRTGEEDDLSQY